MKNDRYCIELQFSAGSWTTTCAYTVTVRAGCNSYHLYLAEESHAVLDRAYIYAA